MKKDFKVILIFVVLFLTIFIATALSAVIYNAAIKRDDEKTATELYPEFLAEGNIHYTAIESPHVRLFRVVDCETSMICYGTYRAVACEINSRVDKICPKE